MKLKWQIRFNGETIAYGIPEEMRTAYVDFWLKARGLTRKETDLVEYILESSVA